MGHFTDRRSFFALMAWLPVPPPVPPQLLANHPVLAHL